MNDKLLMVGEMNDLHWWGPGDINTEWLDRFACYGKLEDIAGNEDNVYGLMRKKPFRNPIEQEVRNLITGEVIYASTKGNLRGIADIYGTLCAFFRQDDKLFVKNLVSDKVLFNFGNFRFKDALVFRGGLYVCGKKDAKDRVVHVPLNEDAVTNEWTEDTIDNDWIFGKNGITSLAVAPVFIGLNKTGNNAVYAVCPQTDKVFRLGEKKPKKAYTLPKGWWYSQICFFEDKFLAVGPDIIDVRTIEVQHSESHMHFRPIKVLPIKSNLAEKLKYAMLDLPENSQYLSMAKRLFLAEDLGSLLNNCSGEEKTEFLQWAMQQTRGPALQDIIEHTCDVELRDFFRQEMAKTEAEKSGLPEMSLEELKGLIRQESQAVYDERKAKEEEAERREELRQARVRALRP